jgi:hypothetical protein
MSFKLICLFFCFFYTSSFAKNEILPLKLIAQAKSLMKSSLNSFTGYKLIESLTTEVGPRLAGSAAEKRARQWAVENFKKLGFKNIRVEPFEVQHWERVKEFASITSPYPQALSITALGGSISTPKTGIEAELVSFATLGELKRAPLKGFKGKIIFVDEKMTRTQDGSGYSVAVKKRSGAAIEAGKRGALAALIRSVGTDHHRFAHTGQMKYEKGVAAVPIAALSAPDADQLARSLSRSKKVIVKLNIQINATGKRPSGNVVAEIPGKRDEIVLIGAHLDSWDLGTGAVDDGAGVGIVMAAANEILKLGIKPNRTIRVVLFGSEEVGLVGAEAYVKKHRDELDKHIVGAESDFGARKIWRMDTFFAQEKLKIAQAILEVLEPLGIAKGNNEAYGGPDIIPLRKAGVAAVTLKQNGWDYFDLHHTADDTFDKIDSGEISQNVAAYSAFAWMCANINDDFKSASLEKNEKKN